MKTELSSIAGQRLVTRLIDGVETVEVALAADTVIALQDEKTKQDVSAALCQAAVNTQDPAVCTAMNQALKRARLMRVHDGRVYMATVLELSALAPEYEAIELLESVLSGPGEEKGAMPRDLLLCVDDGLTAAYRSAAHIPADWTCEVLPCAITLEDLIDALSTEMAPGQPDVLYFARNGLGLDENPGYSALDYGDATHLGSYGEHMYLTDGKLSIPPGYWGGIRVLPAWVSVPADNAAAVTAIQCSAMSTQSGRHGADFSAYFCPRHNDGMDHSSVRVLNSGLLNPAEHLKALATRGLEKAFRTTLRSAVNRLATELDAACDDGETIKYSPNLMRTTFVAHVLVGEEVDNSLLNTLKSESDANNQSTPTLIPVCFGYASEGSIIESESFASAYLLVDSQASNEEILQKVRALIPKDAVLNFPVKPAVGTLTDHSGRMPAAVIPITAAKQGVARTLH